MTGSSFGTEGIIKNTMHFLFCCTFHMIQDDGYGGISSTKKDGVCVTVAASASAQFLQVFYLHQPQALKKSRKTDAANSVMTTVCHLFK